MFKFWLKPFYTEDDGQPQGGDAEGKQRPTDVLDRYGRDALKLAEKLSEALTDNYSLREKNRALRAEKATLEKSQAPEGATLLTAEDATLWEAYKTLGAPDALKTTLESAQTATQEAQALKREKAITEAAGVAGYKPSVLTRLADGLEITVKPDSKGDKRAYVVKDGAETALEDFASREWSDFLPSLKGTQAPLQAPDINGGSRGGANGKHILTDAERDAITRRYQSTF